MPTVADPGVQIPAPAGVRATTFVVYSNAIAAAILIGSELLFFLLALDWSLAGLLHLGPVVSVPVGAVLSVAGLWMTWWFFRRALNAERAVAAGLEPPAPA